MAESLINIVLVLAVFGGILTLFVVLFCIPPYIAYKLFRKWRYSALITAPLIIYYAFSWFRAFYPDDDFYVALAERETGIELDDSTKVIAKAATFPDHFGDYSACMIFTVSERNIKKFETVNIADYSKQILSNAREDTCKRELIEQDGILTKSEIGKHVSVGYNVAERKIFIRYVTH